MTAGLLVTIRLVTNFFHSMNIEIDAGVLFVRFSDDPQAVLEKLDILPFSGELS